MVASISRFALASLPLCLSIAACQGSSDNSSGSPGAAGVAPGFSGAASGGSTSASTAVGSAKTSGSTPGSGGTFAGTVGTTRVSSGGVPSTGGASSGRTGGNSGIGGVGVGGTASTGGRTIGGASGTSGGKAEGVRAIPGAEGFGARVTGGRGGRVIKVTTLAASGPGSLQAALNVDEPRIVVFEVSGVIQSDLVEIPYGDVTIAGQTAPGGGITIAGRLYAAYDDSVGNIIVRHVRIRPSYDGGVEGNQYDGTQFSLNHHVLFDHVSIGFGVDENADFYEATDVTVQWCVIESAATDGHPEGEHNYGLINGPAGRRFSVHHTLFAHNKNRNPAIANGPAEVVNNVSYDGRHGFVHHNPASGHFNFLGNTFRAGPGREMIPFYFDDENEGAADELGYYLSGNVLDGTGGDCTAGPMDNPWSACEADLIRDASYASTARFDFSGQGDTWIPVTASDAATAYESVLARAGAFPRDQVTLRSVQETRARTGSWGARIPEDLMDGLTPGTPPADGDDDGMPDDWESAHGLDPSNGSDYATITSTGYTAIEDYLNELAERLVTGG